jgi:hypothetical protein
MRARLLHLIGWKTAPGLIERAQLVGYDQSPQTHGKQCSRSIHDDSFRVKAALSSAFMQLRTTTTLGGPGSRSCLTAMQQSCTHAQVRSLGTNTRRA